MATHFTHRTPGHPHPMALSATACIIPNSKAKRPPIHNPYDKFTQPEFDAWIGDITGTLRRALGQIEADDEPKLPECTHEESTWNATTRYRSIGLDESEDESVNDSFAEIKARRVLGKGKARDPREGPGLGGADRTKPIEIASSDEEEEHEVQLAIGVEEDDEEDEEEYEDGEEEEENYSEQEGDYSWKRGQSSSQQISSPAKHRKFIREEGSEGSDFEEGSDENEEEGSATRKFRPTEVIDIISEDEDEMDDDGQCRGEENERGAEELQEGSGDTGEYSEEESVRMGTSHLKFHDPRMRSFRDPMDFHYNEEETQAEHEVIEDDDEIEEIQPSEEEEPVRLRALLLEVHAPRACSSRESRPFYYADEEETKAEHDMVQDDDEIEEIQPPETNIAFPLQVRPSARVDPCIDLWAGPRIYAEGSTGGDVRTSPGARSDPNHLGEGDSYEIEEVIPDVTGNKVDVDELQVAEQDTSFPPRDGEQEWPVDIPDPWVGPRTYAEDFYAGGDVKALPGHEVDPSLLEGSVQDDIGVPSTSKGVAQFSIENEEQLEDELENDEEVVIQPPTQHTFSPTSRLAPRALPIPPNAEFISIDVSDEETGSADQEPIKLGPLEGVEVDFHELQHQDVDGQNMERGQSFEVDEIVEEDTAYMHQPIPPLNSALPIEAGIPVVAWPLSSSSVQQDVISMDHCGSLYADIEAVNVQTEEQAEVIPALVDRNCPPAFPAGSPTSAPRLETPSSVESNADMGVEESVVQVLDTEVDSSESVDTFVHEEMITQAGKDSDKVGNTETLVDHVEVSEPHLSSLTLVANSSFSLPSSNDLVNDAQVTERDKGVAVDESVHRHKVDVEITSEDVNQLINEDSADSSAPVQQEMVDDDEMESRDINASMQMKADMNVDNLVSVALNPHIAAGNTEDGILPSAEGIDEQMDNQIQPSASTSSMQVPVLVYHHHHTYNYDQLPTPPPDQSPTAQSPSVANHGPSPSLTSPPRRHKVEIEEIQDEDDARPQPYSTDSAELDPRIDIEPAGNPRYTVVEPQSDGEYVDEDADGEIDLDIEVVSMSSASRVWNEVQSKDEEIQTPMDYVVEEPLTDGRLTEEPGNRAQSLGVISVDPEESEGEARSQVETNIQPQTSNNEETTSNGPPMPIVPSDSISPTLEHDAPMPVIADANVADPTSRRDTPSHPSVSLPAALDVQPQAQARAPGDGLFTPADESVTATPAGPSENIHSQVLDELVHAFFGTPTVPSTPVEELVHVSDEDLLSEIRLPIDPAVERDEAPQTVQPPSTGTEATYVSGVRVSGSIHDATLHDGPISVSTSSAFGEPPVSMHAVLTRKPTDPILVSDPYPYSLSTPGVSLMGPIEEDTEQDNSMSSNSWEKDPEDKDASSILDDADGLELQYPSEPDVSAELNVSAVAKGEDASKTIDEVADVDADGDFDPEFVVTRSPQPSAEIQPVADLPTALGPSNGVEKNGVNPKEIFPIEPAKGISSGDIPPTEKPNHDRTEASTTPPNGNIETATSTRAFKRKRELLHPPADKVAGATAERAEKGKSRKVSGWTSKGKAKATNEEVVDQMTSEATIHVNPRRKTQPIESAASRVLSKNPFEARTSSRSSSNASATYRMLHPTSRSSSIASSVPSDQSVAVVVLPSPTVYKPNVAPVQTPLQPLSLFHAHGLKRNNQNNLPQSSQARIRPTQPPRLSTPATTSLPRIDVDPAAATSPAAVSPTCPSPINVKTVPSPAVRHTPAILSNSPVTRSHCRYRRISLPKEEGGPRVCFLVPGCSLSDKELMAAEEIEDHGDATHEDSLRMIKDIQSLGFDSYFIGTLRQLVGLDILREQEIFYLPQPGEEVVRKTSPRKERSGLFRGADSSSYAGSPGHSGSIRSPASMKAPTSVADSTSTSLSAFRRRLDSEKDSVSAVSETEFEPSDGELPDAKRARPSPPGEQADVGPMGPPLKAQEKRPLKSRRSKQLDVAYQPEEDEKDSDDGLFRSRRKRSSQQGIKRRRGSEITAKDGGDERTSKKVRTRTSTPRDSAT